MIRERNENLKSRKHVQVRTADKIVFVGRDVKLWTDLLSLRCHSIALLPEGSSTFWYKTRNGREQFMGCSCLPLDR